MARSLRVPFGTGALVVSGVASLLVVSVGASQSREGLSASDLVERLTYQSEGAGEAELLGFDCAHELASVEQDRRMAVSLVGMGQAAFHDVDSALDSLEKSGPVPGRTFSPAFLFYAFAESRGVSGSARLRRMIRDPKLRSVQHSLDTAVALSLGLTSYVDDQRSPMGAFFCRDQEPRDALDNLILAWERGDQTYMTESLGPDGLAALKLLVGARTFERTRSDLWHPKDQGVALGYRFAASGAWAAPAETLDSGIASQRFYSASAAKPEVVEIDAAFKSAAGGDCGRALVKFRRAPDAMLRSRYVVDNSDLQDLLRVIGTCAAKGD